MKFLPRNPAIKMALFLFVLILAIEPAYADAEASRNALTRPNMSGPQSVKNTLEAERATRKLDPYELPFLIQYFEWKHKLADEYGVDFGVDYTPVVIKANNTLAGSDDNASGGVFRFLDRGKRLIGALRLSVRWYGSWNIMILIRMSRRLISRWATWGTCV